MKRLFTALLFTFSVYFAHSQCAIKVNTPEACLNTPYSLLADFTGINDSIVWDFGNGLKQYCSPVDHIFTTLGPKTVTLSLYRNGSVFCTQQLNLTVNPLPIPNFTVNSPTPQCYAKNAFIFTNTSTHPASTAIVAKTFYFGDSTAQTITVGDVVTKNYILKNENKYRVGIGVEDAKGCFAAKFVDSAIQVYGALSPSFSSVYTKSCGQTPVLFKNTSYASQSKVSKFTWLMGDNNTSTTQWDSVKYTYTGDGCFKPRLILEDANGCIDTSAPEKGEVCNVNKKPIIYTNRGAVVTYENSEIEFSTPVIPGSTFLWTFGDPASGQQNNFDFKNYNTRHKFTDVGVYEVTFQVNTNGCVFDTSMVVHVKGPKTRIESRGYPNPSYISPAQRYQCSITDTVYFTNNSRFYLNDDKPLNDIGYSFQSFLFYFDEPKQLVVRDSVISTAPVYDTLDLTGSVINKSLKKGKNVYISANADTIKINNASFYFNKYDILSADVAVTRYLVPEHCKPTNVYRLWDFGDMYAPQCTTDSRPIFPKTAQNNNLHFSGTLAPKNTYDANGKWVNCNFSADSLPKHKYTQGKEANYVAKLYLTDTSGRDSAIIVLTPSKNDPAYPDSAKTHIDSVALALTPPNASGLKIKGKPCYGDPRYYGIEFVFTNTQPHHDREMFWIHLDSAADRNDFTPGVFDKWIPQSGTAVDRNFTPHPLATLGLPPNVDSIFWQFDTKGTYPGRIYDSTGWVTVGYKVQNGIDPITKQPCIDEKWYHRAFRYPAINSPEFTTTLSGSCNTPNVKVQFTKSVQDSLNLVIVNWAFGERHIDSFIRNRPEPFTTNTINYRKRYFRNDTSIQLIDSIVTKRISNTGQVLFADFRDSTIEDKTYTYRLNDISRNYGDAGDIIAYGSITNTIETVVWNGTGCSISKSKILPGGLHVEFNFPFGACTGDSLSFWVSPRYKSDIPDFTYGYLDTFNYWRNPTIYPDMSPRPKPQAGYESVRWDFGAGKGWQSGKINGKTVYTSSGKYLVQAEITDSLGCKQIIADSIFVSQGVTGFTINDEIQCSDTNLFVFTSPFVPADKASVTWKFGNFKTSNKLTDTISFPNPGSYKVQLTATNPLDCATHTEKTVLVLPKIKPVFSVDTPRKCYPNTSFNFKVGSIDTPGLKYKWDFSDGTTSTQTTVSHTFPQAGSYPVKLKWDYDECADSFYYCVDVVHAPNANFSILPQAAPGAYVFSPQDLGQAAYQWQFGDGGNSTTTSPAHVYQQPGTYIVSLTVLGNNGCAAVHTDTVDFSMGIEDVYNATFINITPNPFKNTLTITNKGLEGAATIEVYDISGKRVLTQSAYFTASGDKVELNTGNLPAGVYVVQVKDENATLKGVFKVNRME